MQDMTNDGGRGITGGSGKSSVRLDAHGVFRVRSKLRDLGVREAGLIDRRTDIIDLRRVLELQLHQRSAGELDAVVHAVDCKEAEADNDPRDGEDRRLFPMADEIVLRIVKYAKHWQPLMRVTAKSFAQLLSVSHAST